MTEINFVNGIINPIDAMVATYLDSCPAPAPPPQRVLQQQASITMATWAKPGQFPSELSRVVRVMTPQWGDYTTVRERLSFKMIMPGPLPHNTPLRGMRAGGGAREPDQHDNSDNQFE